MTSPTIKALGVTQDGAPTRWQATGYVEGVGWLVALAAQRVAAQQKGE